MSHTINKIFASAHWKHIDSGHVQTAENIREAELISWGEPNYFVEPKTHEKIRRWCVFPHNDGSFSQSCTTENTMSLRIISCNASHLEATNKHVNLSFPWIFSGRACRLIGIDSAVFLLLLELLCFSWRQPFPRHICYFLLHVQKWQGWNLYAKEALQELLVDLAGTEILNLSIWNTLLEEKDGDSTSAVAERNTY